MYFVILYVLSIFGIVIPILSSEQSPEKIVSLMQLAPCEIIDCVAQFLPQPHSNLWRALCSKIKPHQITPLLSRRMTSWLLPHCTALKYFKGNPGGETEGHRFEWDLETKKLILKLILEPEKSKLPWNQGQIQKIVGKSITHIIESPKRCCFAVQGNKKIALFNAKTMEKRGEYPLLKNFVAQTIHALSESDNNHKHMAISSGIIENPFLIYQYLSSSASPRKIHKTFPLPFPGYNQNWQSLKTHQASSGYLVICPDQSLAQPQEELPIVLINNRKPVIVGLLDPNECVRRIHVSDDGVHFTRISNTHSALAECALTTFSFSTKLYDASTQLIRLLMDIRQSRFGLATDTTKKILRTMNNEEWDLIQKTQGATRHSIHEMLPGLGKDDALYLSRITDASPAAQAP